MKKRNPREVWLTLLVIVIVTMAIGLLLEV